MPQASFDHAPKVARGFFCPQPSVTLPIQTRKGEFEVTFVFDTGCAITLVPKPAADALGVEYDKALAGEKDSPKTLTGRMKGHVGTIRTTFLTCTLEIPCFVYIPTNPPKTPLPPGPTGVRTRVREIVTFDDYVKELDRNEESEKQDTQARCLLGRLGFLNRFHVLIDSRQTTVSTDPLAPPRRSLWSRLAFWRTAD